MGMAELDLEAIRRVDPSKVSTIYGPVRSWRVGASLGVDLLCLNSICSFNCTYCQLGFIQVHTNRRACFVPTRKVMEDLEQSDWESADIITFSGSGEPTLASNLGEVVRRIREFTGKPQLLLTNGTLLGQSEVRQEILPVDRVYVKLDAGNEEAFRRVNRPAGGITLERVVAGMREFREIYGGYLGIQMMFLPSNLESLGGMIEIVNSVRPQEVQVNVPRRPYPDAWYLASRGSHEGVDYPARPLKTLTREEVRKVVARLRAATRGIEIVSVLDRR